MRANCLWMSAIFAQSRLSIILQIRRHVQIRDVICFYFIWRVHLDKVRFFASAHARISASMFTDYLLVCNVNAASRLNSQWPSNFLPFAKAVISTVGGGQVSLTFQNKKFLSPSCLLFQIHFLTKVSRDNNPRGVDKNIDMLVWVPFGYCHALKAANRLP